MPITHFFLAILVIVIWGLNFIFVKFALDELSPLLLCAVRFMIASVPAIFFIKPPAIPFRIVALYGLITFALQFALLFTGMHLGMPPGMASLVLQVQIFFSMLFAALLYAEWPSLWQIAGALVSFSGIALVSTHFDESISLVGFLFILAAAAAWGIGNLITKNTKKINMIALVVWGSFVATFPMLILSILVEGTQTIIDSYHHITWLGATSVLYIVFASTWVGYGAWNWLLSRHPISIIVPFTLLVPIVGIISAILILGEPFQTWKLTAGLLVISGLCINLFGARFASLKRNTLLLDDSNLNPAPSEER